MSKVISVRLPDTLLEQIDQLCLAVGRRRNALVQTALESYVRHFGDYEVARKEKQEKDYAKLVKAVKKILGGNE